MKLNCKKITKFIVASTLLISGIGFTASVNAEELDSIKKEGVLRIAMSGAYPPFNFVNEENEVVGFDPDIGKEIAKRIGVKAEIITTAWDGILAGLLANKYDAIVGSMSITDKRKKVVDFVGPYYQMSRGIFVSDSSSIKSIDDVSGKKVGATLGETHEKWARTQNNWKIKTYKGLPELLLELKNNRVQAIVSDDIPVLLAIKKSGNKVRALDTSNLKGVADQAGIAVRKGNPELLAAMQKALEEMQADGTYKEIALKWIGADIR